MKFCLYVQRPQNSVGLLGPTRPTQMHDLGVRYCASGRCSARGVSGMSVCASASVCKREWFALVALVSQNSLHARLFAAGGPSHVFGGSKSSSYQP